MKINEKEILNSKIAKFYRSEYGATDEMIMRVEVFRYFQYGVMDGNYSFESLSLVNSNDIDFEKEPWQYSNYIDNYLRVTEDEDVLVVELYDLAKYLLKRYYDAPTELCHEYALQLILNNLNIKAFVKCLEMERMGSFMEINGKYYVFVDSYLLNHSDIRFNLENSPV